MTAEAEQTAAAAAAVALGEQLSGQYHDAAAAFPGVGLAVALPSAFDAPGPVQGLGFNIPREQPALRKPDPVSPPGPDYADEVVGGLVHHAATSGGQGGLDGVSWPGSSGRQSVIAYVGRGSKVSAARPSVVKAARARVRRSLRGR
jgi:hypothetical protein